MSVEDPDIHHNESPCLLLENEMFVLTFSSKSRKVNAMFKVAKDLQEFSIAIAVTYPHGNLFSEDD